MIPAKARKLHGQRILVETTTEGRFAAEILEVADDGRYTHVEKDDMTKEWIETRNLKFRCILGHHIHIAPAAGQTPAAHKETA